jgi:hypothetical protein
VSTTTTAGCTQFWTAADDAELDVLLSALVTDYDEHRKFCRACRPDPDSDAPNPCPSLMRAIAEVVNWRDARLLRTRAEVLRAQLERSAA